MDKKKIYNLIYSGKINYNDVVKIDKLLKDKIIYIGNYKIITDMTKQLGIKTLITDVGTCFKIELLS